MLSRGAAGRNLAERLHPLVLEQLFYDFGARQSLARGCLELARAVALLARVLAHLLAKLGPFVKQGEAAGKPLLQDGELSDQRGLGGEHVADVAAELPDAGAVVRPQHAAAFGTAQRKRFIENITVRHGMALQFLPRATTPLSARLCPCKLETGCAACSPTGCSGRPRRARE